MRDRVNRMLRRVPVPLVWLLGLMPLGWIVWLTLSGGIGVDPVEAIEHRLGKVALWFLIGGLAMTPAMRQLGVNLIRFRRAIGLLAFTYIVLHLAAWAVLDMGLLWDQVLRDLSKRTYLMLGLVACLLLLPLALTSNDLSVRRLGRGWNRLHRLVYPAALLAVAHYLMQMKVVTGQGWLWLALTLALLALRLPAFRRRRIGLW